MPIDNPVIKHKKNGINKTSDPFVTFYEGKYYHCYDLDNKIGISCFDSLDMMGSDNIKTVIAVESNELFQHYAPELHKIGNRWYIYTSPCRKNSENHFVCVYESEDENPVGKYHCLGTVEGIGEKWSIDATVFEYLGKRYMLYTTCANIYLAEMASPNKLIGEIVEITSCEYEWETVMSGVVEGPCVIFNGETPYLVYSASDSRCDDYCLGLIRFVGGDILNPQNWVKQSTPILTKKVGMYGPGHCSFTYKDGQMYCVFHANLQSGTGWQGRSVFIKKCHFERETIIFEN